ncbi:hypothetical protein CLV59_101109 [Chitinophaga dinghuensis]|uniref:Uncharacterized protein n=1 Tax=Chitinophaga dinghuensis TaxID=1539050 RepID=A0A327WDC5_9BACT|nr:hypothetical protein [Chitinophaga dinghuensis]RAJ87360.1 hypothetical protein CLV59_101109 [Chitinophaga dinghuensis]
MKKMMLMGAAATMLFFACSKDKDKNNGPVTVEYDGTSLTTAVKVNHGVVVNGNIPDASTDATAPKLAAEMSTDSYSAVAGRYIIVPLKMENTTVPTGAYVKFEGATSYFKIDFSKPVNGRQAGENPSLERATVADSGIVIQLPNDIRDKVFKLIVAAYDATGKISNPVTLSVSVLNTAANMDAQAFVGKWHPTRQKDTSWHPLYADVETYSWFTCRDGRPAYTYDSLSTSDWRARDYFRHYDDVYLQLLSDGSGVDYRKNTVVSVDMSKSVCGALTNVTNTTTYNLNISWGYNAATKKMIVVYDLGGTGKMSDFMVTEAEVYLENGKLYTKVPSYVNEYVKQ